MIQVKFKNMESSKLATRIATDRIEEAITRFPRSSARRVVVTLISENSPAKPGPDLYKVRTEVIGGSYHGLILEKEAPSLYAALAEVSDGLLERFNRYSDRIRTKARKEKRQFDDSQRIIRKGVAL